MNAVWNENIVGFRANILIGRFLLAPLVGTLLIIDLIMDHIEDWLKRGETRLFRRNRRLRKTSRLDRLIFCAKKSEPSDHSKCPRKGAKALMECLGL